ncbi:hypothetical protein GE061_006544 [Apolygus lucorum]|uniref:Uncharacterized protein n=1 Tax=Apolygus lucorum TaxID=248454 RepID=A0A6A4J576_APOLU|nr:hypothetical protein GE061_006544 [Apolygus lucorum]
MALLFADDVAILADSLPDAQKKVDALLDYCKENQLTINSKKSNILVFDKEGRAARRRKVMCGDEEIRPVPSFQYLGVTFCRTGKFNQNKERMIKKARTAIGCTRDILCRGKVDSWDAKFKLFDTLVASVLLYAAEVWGLWYLEDIEVVQMLFLKSTLCLSRGVPGHFLRLEMDRLPLKVGVLERALGFLSRILKMGENRWPKLCLRELVAYHNNPRNSIEFNWVTRLDDICQSVGVKVAWDSLTYETFQIDRQNIMTGYRNHCRSADIQRTWNSKYNSLFRNMLDYDRRQGYLEKAGNVHRERLIAQLRLATTNRDMGRIKFYHRRNRYELANSENCTTCNLMAPETLSHFLLVCPLYSPYRSFYLGRYILNRQGEAAESVLSSLLETGDDRRKIGDLYQYTLRSLMLRAFANGDL